jgi:hypothetical protein
MKLATRLCMHLQNPAAQHSGSFQSCVSINDGMYVCMYVCMYDFAARAGASTPPTPQKVHRKALIFRKERNLDKSERCRVRAPPIVCVRQVDIFLRAAWRGPIPPESEGGKRRIRSPSVHCTFAFARRLKSVCC